MMRKISTFLEAHEALKQFVPDGTHTGPYTLDTIRQLMEFLGNPQNCLKIVHVAGTSGKTSTAYYIAELLTDVGYTTGLSISPHINELNERAQINMAGLPEAEYCRELSEFLDLVDQSGLRPSHFETLVAFAYWLFDKRSVDYAVIEVGLGGLLDGTNVVDRSDKICVITDIGLDHTEVLGDTLAKIAAQKAGIIHKGNTVFLNAQSNDVMEVIKQNAKDHDAEVHVQEPHGDNRLNSLPVFQQRNFQLALAVATHIAHTVSDDDVKRAVGTYIPGRMEIMSYHGKTLILDGAHNEQKISALVDAVKTKFSDQTLTLLVSFGQNKETSVSESLQLLRTLSDSIIITRFDHAQDEVRSSITVDRLAQYAKDAGFLHIKSESDQAKALELLVDDDSDIGLVTGSFYLIENYKNTILK